MAYISQDEKKAIAPKIKAICEKYGVKGTLSINNHSTLVLTVKSGKLDPWADMEFPAGQIARVVERQSGYVSVNPYWYDSHYTGKTKDFLNEVIPALRGEGWYDNSDIQSDYFDVKHYVDVKFGRWNAKYEVTK